MELMEEKCDWKFWDGRNNYSEENEMEMEPSLPDGPIPVFGFD